MSVELRVCAMDAEFLARLWVRVDLPLLPLLLLLLAASSEFGGPRASGQ